MIDQLSAHTVMLFSRELSQPMSDFRVHVWYPGQSVLHTSTVGVIDGAIFVRVHVLR